MFGRSVSPSIVSEICMHYFGRLTMPALSESRRCEVRARNRVCVASLLGPRRSVDRVLRGRQDQADRSPKWSRAADLDCGCACRRGLEQRWSDSASARSRQSAFPNVRLGSATRAGHPACPRADRASRARVLPDGRHFLFYAMGSTTVRASTWVSSARWWSGVCSTRTRQPSSRHRITSCICSIRRSRSSSRSSNDHARR